MNLVFQKLLPESFEVNPSESSIWGVNTTWECGGTYLIQAASGSGKTTLVSVIAGLRGDYKGEILSDGRAFSSYKPADWSEWRSRTASFVYQDLRLFPKLSVFENCALAGELAGIQLPQGEIEKLTAQLGIGDKLHTPVARLSFGQMQRTAIIRALVRPYRWLILDEPFSHLDLHNAELAWNLILQDARSKSAGIVLTCLDPLSFIHPDRNHIL